MRLPACLLALACITSTLTFAQVDLVDPDAPKTPPRPRKAVVAQPEAEEADDPNDGNLVAPPTPKKTPPPKKGLPVVEQPKPEPPPKQEPPKLIVRTTSDADLRAVWNKWSQANQSKNANAELAARKELLATKALIGSENMEVWAVGLLRAAEAWEEAGDSGAAVEIANSAAEMAPDLPATWFLLARLYLKADPSGGKYIGAMQKGIAAQFADARYLRPLIADVVAVLLLALIVTSVVVLIVFALRRGYYFLYDFHFFFPRAAARWQTGAIAILLLSLPIVFRMGVAPTLLALFAALTMYLTVRERVVAVVLIGLLGFVPVIAGVVVDQTAFAETPAEDLYRIERGGPGIEPLVQKYEKLGAEDKIGFAERFVLGRYHLNRGHLEQAVAHLKGALALRPDDVPAKLALAKAFFLMGDLENSRSMYEGLKNSAPSAIGLVNLARVYQRRVQVYGEANLTELDKAAAALSEARQLDPTVPFVAVDGPEPREILGNTYLSTLPLTQSDLLALAKNEVAADRVRSQFSQLLVGDVPGFIAPLFPLLAALVLLGMGFLSNTIEAARVCNRCGRAVSRRGDPDVSPGSPMCTQCVNVFARKNVVAPSVKVRKQLEVARYESQKERASTILGVLWSGMGHVFAGMPVRGAIFGFLFITAITAAVLRSGVVRAPYEGAPVLLKLLPAILLFLIVYPVSLLALRRRQS
ncbi:MAG: tetratricopeptide repeat protein [Archangium sp.]